MSIIVETRPSDSSYIESVMRGRTLSDGAPIRPAEIHWHMVFSTYEGVIHPIFVGPWTSSGIVHHGEGAEILWVKFKLGTFLSHLPTRDFLNSETILPQAASNSFWLKGSAWQFPDFENVETFVDRLVHDGTLVHDPLVSAVLQDHPQDVSPRTVRHRFLNATGLTQKHIRQMQRAQQAVSLLQQGQPILDVVYEMGYFDQPHLTRSLKQFIGYTPAQIIQQAQTT